ncbi:hypothetical protein M378DRAFT_18643 [Amanita muscaria Koide BX008]|uniref:DUF4100 domain-containing protein n=1 Tax=Amanita muscaria (strain Koide BX008) TaxID=946122 RepID=A0A0C2W0Q7_AMAMK|nr:hypothetical protein M378DRAFT_18643 [Amanita muscaria Koide BX008]
MANSESDSNNPVGFDVDAVSEGKRRNIVNEFGYSYRNPTGWDRLQRDTSSGSKNQGISAFGQPISTTSPSAVLGVPMPAPGSSKAPSFKGKHVSEFIARLEVHADAANLPKNQLPGYVLRYCNPSVARVIKHRVEAAADDWDKVSDLLKKLYGSNTKAPVRTEEKLRRWVKDHAKKGSISNLKAVDKYCREFIARSDSLVQSELLPQRTADYLFYKGVPDKIKKIISRKLKPEQMKRATPASLDVVYDLLKREFDDESIDVSSDYDSSDTSASSDSNSDDSSDSNDDYKKKKDSKSKRKTKKKVKAKSSTDDSDSSSDESDSSSDDSDTDLKKKKHNKGKRKSKKKTRSKGKDTDVNDGETGRPAVAKKSSFDELKRQMMDFMQLQMTTRSVSTSFLPPNAYYPPNDRKCFMCDKAGTHRLGIQYCDEIANLIRDGFIKYNEQGRLVRQNGSPLPRADPGSGGIAKILRDERGQIPPRDGAARLAYAGHVGLQYEGRDLISDQTIGIFTYPNQSVAMPVTRSHGKRNDQAEPTKPAGGGGSNNDKGLIDSADGKGTNQPPAQKLDVQQEKPPVVNTEQGWRSFKDRQRCSQEQKDGYDKTRVGGYHFTSDIQDAVNRSDVQERILNSEVTLSLREVLSISNDMQRRIGNLLKSRRVENIPKSTNLVYYDGNTDGLTKVSDVLWVNANEALGLCNVANAPFVNSIYPANQSMVSSASNTGPSNVSEAPFIPSSMQISFDGSQSVKDSFAAKYSFSAMLDTPLPNILAWTTGRFVATLGGHKVEFMVDTGSELNLISDSFFRRTNMALEIDGVRWSLKGINGGAVPMVGLLRNVEVDIGGHRFDHHFFVSTEGTGNQQDVLLGQPWLHWYSANLAYTRKGSTLLKLWKNGDSDTQYECGSVSRFSLMNWLNWLRLD